MRSYKDFKVYQKSYDLALRIHRVTLNFPDFEKYEIASQMRRASKSIPLNIGEGFARRKSSEDFKRFLTMSIGSCDEMKILIEFAKDLCYIDNETYEEFISEYEQVGKMLYRLHKNWRRL
jgi:four helix bundle protein